MKVNTCNNFFISGCVLKENVHFVKYSGLLGMFRVQVLTSLGARVTPGVLGSSVKIGK